MSWSKGLHRKNVLLRHISAKPVQNNHVQKLHQKIEKI